MSCQISLQSEIIENLIEIGINVPSFLKNGLKVYNEIVEKTFDNLISSDENTKK